MAKPKKLTVSAINKLDSIYDQTETILILGAYQHTIHTHFRKSDIQKLIIDYFTALQELKELQGFNEQADFDQEAVVNATSLLNVLIIKYFSDIEIPQLNNVETMVRFSKALLDLGVMEEVFSEKGFPKDQLDLLGEEINKAAQKMSDQFSGMMAVRSDSNA